MKTAITIIQLTSAILLSLSILLQVRSSGLSATFGGTEQFFHAKRGAEKILSVASVIFAIIFLASSYSITFLA